MRGRRALGLALLAGAAITASPQVTAQNQDSPAQPATAQRRPPRRPSRRRRRPDTATAAHGTSRCRARRQASGPGAVPRPPAPPPPPEVLERGKTMYSSLCSACHGADARGGQLGGVNLLRSPGVLGDSDGELVLPIIKNGRPGTAMVAIPMTGRRRQGRRRVTSTACRRKAASRADRLRVRPSSEHPGRRRQRPARRSSPRTAHSCHSTTGDLAGIASRVARCQGAAEPVGVGRTHDGPRAGRRRRGGPTGPPRPSRSTLPDEVVEGRARAPRRLPGHGSRSPTGPHERSGATATRRTSRSPIRSRATTSCSRCYTNKNMHDVTAFLATLK